MIFGLALGQDDPRMVFSLGSIELLLDDPNDDAMHFRVLVDHGSQSQLDGLQVHLLVLLEIRIVNRIPVLHI